MCGIVGVIKINAMTNITDEKAFRNGLIIDSTRGAHSTGVASVSVVKGRPQVSVSKLKGNPFEFLADRPSFVAKKALIGHNRYATSGQITTETAHPFLIGGIAGVHNGTVDESEFGYTNPEHDVDSYCLYKYLEAHGVQKAWSKVQGDAALVWYDVNKDTVNFVRNERRPLYWLADDKSIYFASTRAILTAMVESVQGPTDNGQPAAKGEIKEFVPHEHVAFNLTTGKSRIVKLEAPKQRPKQAVFPSYYGGGKLGSYNSVYRKPETCDMLVESVKVENLPSCHRHIARGTVVINGESRTAVATTYKTAIKFQKVLSLNLKAGDIVEFEPYGHAPAANGEWYGTLGDIVDPSVAKEKEDLEEEAATRCSACAEICTHTSEAYLEGEKHQYDDGVELFFCGDCLECWDSYK